MSDPELYYEDLPVGRVDPLGAYTMSKAEVIEFAERYDPQPFHVNEDAAADSVYGGIIASGWHTVAVANRLTVDGFLSRLANIGGLGTENLTWHAPVRPGDTLTGELEITDARVSESDPGRGIVRQDKRVWTREDEEQVLSYSTVLLVARRSAT